MTDTHNLNRFITAQNFTYKQVYKELKNGHKCSHWMWFIFPQFKGLGSSSISKEYAIKSREEAEAYLAHPLLLARLIECCELLLMVENKTISEIFGFPDDVKLQSSMTLFKGFSQDEIFQKVLDKYFEGEEDSRTIALIASK